MGNNRGHKNKKRYKKYLYIFIGMFLLMILILPMTKSDKEKVNMSVFYEDVEEDLVEEVYIFEGNRILEYKKKDSNELYVTDISVNFSILEEDILNELSNDGVTVEYAKKANIIGTLLGLFSILLNVFILAVIVFFIYYIVKKVGDDVDSDLDNSKKVENLTFDDIAGYEGVKEEIKNILEYLKNPDKLKKYSVDIPRGILFEGDPGNGKTMFAKVLANESKTPFYYISGADIEGRFVSQGAGRIKSIFKKVREAVEKEGKAILFIDELDTIGLKRENRTVTETNQTINKLLTELDGFRKDDNLLVIGATNLAKHLDSALIRPGRFDRVVRIEKPSRKDRESILQLYYDKLEEEIKDKEVIDQGYLEIMSKMTSGFSGSGLARLIKDGALIAYQNNSLVDMKSLKESYLRLVMGLPVERDMSKKDREIIAYHESAHAVMSMVNSDLGYRSVAYGTIKSYGNALGHVAIVENEEVLLRKSDFNKKIYVLLAGRAVEDILLEGDFTNGASNDLMKVDRLIKHYLKEGGMSENNQNAYIENQGKDDDWILKETKDIRESLYTETLEMVNKHMEDIKRLAEYLLENEEINQDEIKEMFGHKYSKY